MLAHYTEQVRRDATDDGVSVVTSTPRVVRRSATGELGWSEISWMDLDESNANQAIDEQIEFFATTAQAFVWKVYQGDRPVDMDRRLEQAGFVALGVSELMIARVSDVTTPIELPEGVTLEHANDPAGIERLIEVHRKVFATEHTRLHHTLLAQLSLAPQLNDLVVAVAGGVPVSSARIQFLPGSDFAGLWGGSTLPEWRGRGLYRTLVAHRARVAAQRGYSYLFVTASALSRPTLERLGFEAMGSVATFEWRPGPSPTTSRGAAVSREHPRR